MCVDDCATSAAGRPGGSKSEDAEVGMRPGTFRYVQAGPANPCWVNAICTPWCPCSLYMYKTMWTNDPLPLFGLLDGDVADKCCRTGLPASLAFEEARQEAYAGWSLLL